MEKLKTSEKVEELKLPDEVVDKGWENSTIDFELYKKEANYISPDKIPEESIEKIKSMKLNKERGHKLLGMIFPLESKNKQTA